MILPLLHKTTLTTFCLIFYPENIPCLYSMVFLASLCFSLTAFSSSLLITYFPFSTCTDTCFQLGLCLPQSLANLHKISRGLKALQMAKAILCTTVHCGVLTLNNRQGSCQSQFSLPAPDIFKQNHGNDTKTISELQLCSTAYSLGKWFV